MDKKKIISIVLAVIVVILIGVVIFLVTRNVEVKFDSDGGSAVETQRIKKNTTATKPEDPTKEDYAFEGWYLDGEEFDFSTKVTKNITLLAKWTATSFTVNFDLNGGEGTLKSIKFKDGVITSLPVPERDGYTFLGWFNGNTEYKVNDKIVKNLTLKAMWEKINNGTPVVNEPVVYKVTFDSNGGSSVANQIVNEKGLVSEPSTPERDGYTFLGWYLNGNKYDFNTVLEGNITLVANWDAIISYKVEKVDSKINQVRIFILKANEKVAGTIDATDSDGDKATFNIPKEGYVTLDGYKLSNPKVTN